MELHGRWRRSSDARHGLRSKLIPWFWGGKLASTPLLALVLLRLHFELLLCFLEGSPNVLVQSWSCAGVDNWGAKIEEKCRLFSVLHKSAGMDTSERSRIGGQAGIGFLAEWLAAWLATNKQTARRTDGGIESGKLLQHALDWQLGIYL